MKTKLSLLFLFVALSATAVFSQGNELKARMEYEDAEIAFQNEEYEKTLKHLLYAYELLEKKWTPKVGYLMVILLDKLIDYGFLENREASEWYFDLNKYFVKEYMEYAEKNPDKVEIDRIREIYEIEKRMNYGKKQFEWEDMSEFKSGQAAYNDENYEEAITWFKKASDKGNVTAMTFIGVSYYKIKDNQEARNWNRKAANQGCGLSAALLSALFFEDESLMTQEEAKKWAVISADKGVSLGMFYLAILYDKEDNCKKVIEWAKKAAYKGSSQAKEGLALLYEEGTCVEKDINKAIEWRNK